MERLNRTGASRTEQTVRSAKAEQGALEAMAEQGAQKAMAEQGAQEAMVELGALEAMAVQGAPEAMAGGLSWPWPWPPSTRPGHYSRDLCIPPKKIHGAVTGYQEPSGTRQTGTGQPTGKGSPPWAKLGS